MKCSICNENDMKYVCHHCGRPICSNPVCDKQIDDPAFGEGYGSAVRAHHCPQCLEKYHPERSKSQRQ